MNETNKLQGDFLAQLLQSRRPAAVYTINGFKLKGRITACDEYTILLEDSQGRQNLVYKSAVSTIVREECCEPAH